MGFAAYDYVPAATVCFIGLLHLEPDVLELGAKLRGIVQLRSSRFLHAGDAAALGDRPTALPENLESGQPAASAAGVAHEQPASGRETICHHPDGRPGFRDGAQRMH